MMKAETLEHLCCPACRKGLELKAEEFKGSQILSGKLICQGCQKGFEIKNGLPNLVYPEPANLPEMDAKFFKQYEQIASSYDRAVRLGLLLLGFWEPQTRKRELIAPLELKRGDWVLEMGAGTGSNLPIIAKQIGKSGKLFALDLSSRKIKEQVALLCEVQKDINDLEEFTKCVVNL